MESINPNDGLDQDPDYIVPLDSNKNNQNMCEEKARCTAKKITKILETEFSKEIDSKKKEIFKIYETLNKACKMLHYLRFAIVTDYYNQENVFIDDKQSSKQSRLHCTVNAPTKEMNYIVDCQNDCFKETNTSNTPKRKVENDPNESTLKILKMDTESPYFNNRKIKKRIVVGNYSKWIPPHSRENDATHKWTVYIVDSQKDDLGSFVSKVRFFLHPSYQPNDVIELSSSPFHLSRLGWGEFPIRVQLHFKNSRNKPVDIIHNLNLDRTYTGLLTIGSETIVDIWINTTDRSLPCIDDKNEKSSFLTKKDINDSDVSLHIAEKSNENVSLIIKKEKVDDDPVEQNNSENSNSLCQPFFSDHDYIKTNFIPITSKNDLEYKTSKNNFKKKPNKSLLKSNYANKSCTITINKGKIYSSNQSHNFDKLPLNEIENSTQNFNIEKFYTDPESYLPGKDHFKKIISLIEQARPKNLFSMLKLVIRRIPLTTEKSTNPYYKLLFPYACESYQVFNTFTLGKQHALERYQALHALDIMKDIQCFESSCSVKEFMTWARRYGYTPSLNLKNLKKLSITSEAINVEEISKQYDSTVTISMELKNWLFKNQNIKPSIKEVSSDSDNEIDIINIQSGVTNSLSGHRESIANKAHVIILDYPQKYNSLNEFVCKSAQKIGIKLTNEEIIPGVSHSSASLVISIALECLVDELTRTALSCAIDKCHVEKNIVDFKVDIDDVQKALIKREEFDILTNAGLGSEG